VQLCIVGLWGESE